jgi:metal-responsive CopG/Arc/MetJ family transcriptional regulator
MNTNLTFSVDLIRAADKLAREMGVSRNDVFRKAMERYLEQQAQIHEEALSTMHGTHAPALIDEDW